MSMNMFTSVADADEFRPDPNFQIAWIQIILNSVKDFVPDPDLTFPRVWDPDTTLKKF
jgi:hypothetical protein